MSSPSSRARSASKAWLPVETQVLTTDLAEALGLKDQKGVRITQVFPGGTADRQLVLRKGEGRRAGEGP